MANYYHMDVHFGVDCIVCSQRKLYHYDSAGTKPSRHADFLRDLGWTYNNDKGWTCPECVARNPRKKAARTAGMMRRITELTTRLEHYQNSSVPASSYDYIMRDLTEAWEKYNRLK